MFEQLCGLSSSAAESRGCLGCMPAVVIGPLSDLLPCYIVWSTMSLRECLSLSLDTGYLVFYLNAYAPSGGNVPTLTLH